MENVEKHQELLLELLKSSFGHGEFNEKALNLQVQFLFENLLEAGLVELTACGFVVVRG